MGINTMHQTTSKSTGFTAKPPMSSLLSPDVCADPCSNGSHHGQPPRDSGLPEDMWRPGDTIPIRHRHQLLPQRVQDRVHQQRQRRRDSSPTYSRPEHPGAAHIRVADPGCSSASSGGMVVLRLHRTSYWELHGRCELQPRRRVSHLQRKE